MRYVIPLLFLGSVGLGAQQAVPSHAVQRKPAASEAREVARVNGVVLTSLRLEAALSRLIPMESFHRNVNATKVDELRARALDQIVEEELEYQDGTRTGIVISSRTLDDAETSLRKKYGSQQALAAALARSGATLGDLRRELIRSMTAAEALRRAVTTRCQVSRTDARAYFDANPDRFTVPEQLHLRAITVGVDPSAGPTRWQDAKARAERLHAQLLNGASFEDLARTNSTDPSASKGGDMGYVHRGALTDEFERATHGLAVNAPSDVIQSLYGYHIVQVVEVVPPTKKTFPEVATDLQRDLTTTRCETLKREWLASLRARSTVVLQGRT